MISHSNRFLFHHIPKCATQSIYEAIIGVCEGDMMGNEGTLNPLYPQEIWEEYFSFTVIRDSVSRAKSAYTMFKYHNPQITPSYFLERAIDEDDDEVSKNCGGSSNDWRNPDLSIRLHCLPLRSPILDLFDNNYKTKVKYVAKFDTLKEDFIELSKRGVPLNNVPHLNTYPNIEGLPQKYVKKLEEYYKEDRVFMKGMNKKRRRNNEDEVY